jgi:tRNA pseudouridine55 synthase
LETDTWDKDYYEKFNQYQVVEKDWKKGIIKGNRFIPAPNIEQIKKILDNIKGEVLLPLPIFSAKKIKGRRLYDLARKGKELRITKKMKIYDYKILNYDFPYLKLGLKVGSGTYIRSIWYYIGKQLGLPAALTELRRTAIWDRSVYNLFK